MYLTALIISLCWIAWCLIQLALAGYFYRITSAAAPADATPKGRAAILLAVRGSDPSFAKCVCSLMEQDYPDFEIHVVVDSDSDPAWQTVTDAIENTPSKGQLHIHLLENPLETCGLKCSALIHGVKQISPEVEYLTMVDSDVVVHPHWLKDLLAPLSNPKVGVVTGNQWFEPLHPAGSASLVRSLWNAGAIVPTVMFRHPWAGSLAMRKCDFERADLLKIWSNSIVDDGPIADAFKPFGLETRFVTSLVTVNEESCDAKFVMRYVQRMLTWSKHYEPTFRNTIVHSLVTGSLLLAILVIAVAAAITGQFAALGFAAAGIILASILNFLGYIIVRAPIARMRKKIGKPMPPLSPARMVKLALLTNVTQLLYAKSVLGAMCNRTVHWRGATYHLDGSSNCELIKYQPFVGNQADSSII